jgi:cupin superfamily acireductone dioxygenase involved in methionine salvage
MFKILITDIDDINTFNTSDNFIYTWKTEEELSTNSFVMADFIEYHLHEDWDVTYHDGTYAEVRSPDGDFYELHASGNGDFYNHKVEFIKMGEYQCPYN